MNHHSDFEFDPKKIHLTDFGVSHIVRLPNDSGGVNIVPGCVQYLAPEFRHFKTVEPTTMSDMWTVGCIGYEMCMGVTLTTDAECFQEIEAHVQGQPLDLRRVPERFGQPVCFVIQGCMETAPEKRITAAKLAEDLRALLHLMKYGMKDTAENNSFLNQTWR